MRRIPVPSRFVYLLYILMTRTMFSQPSVQVRISEGRWCTVVVVYIREWSGIDTTSVFMNLVCLCVWCTSGTVKTQVSQNAMRKVCLTLCVVCLATRLNKNEALQSPCYTPTFFPLCFLLVCCWFFTLNLNMVVTGFLILLLWSI